MESNSGFAIALYKEPGSGASKSCRKIDGNWVSSWIVMASESTTVKSNVSLVQTLIIFHLDDENGALNSLLASFVPCPLSLLQIMIILMSQKAVGMEILTPVRNIKLLCPRNWLCMAREL